MNECGINDIEIGETILTKYPNGGWGTVVVDEIQGRRLYVHETWGAKVERIIHFPNDYGPGITKIKIKKEWDNEENNINNGSKLATMPYA